MPAVVRTEFALALNQVATERGIDPAVVLETIKVAILAAYRKDYGGALEDLENYTVELNPDNGEAKVFKDGKDITPPGFGRIAAQTAKQVILQRIREAEKSAILSDFSTKVGTVISGMILRFDGSNIVVDIGRTQSVMPTSEQIPSERYRLNQRLSFYLEGIRETYKGNEIVVSRAHKGLVSGLFKREVPEVSQGAVEIKEIAREAGSRTKIAVYSTQPGVDPVGSCVGQKGVRVQAVISELGGEEKIDIIQWSEDTAQFITAALAPAKELSIKLNEKTKSAEVTVPNDQLSLAIGREGQNVRLAAKLTGWKIDLRGKDDQKAKAVVSDEVKVVKDEKVEEKTSRAKKSAKKDKDTVSEEKTGTTEETTLLSQTEAKSTQSEESKVEVVSTESLEAGSAEKTSNTE